MLALFKQLAAHKSSQRVMCGEIDALEFAVARFAAHGNLLEMSDPFFPLPTCRKIPTAMAALVFSLSLLCRTQAHQVPSLTVEALFAADHSYTLRVSLDPRLFLSDQPSALPPVPIEWYRDQSQKDLEETRQKAADYLRHALTLKFGEKSLAVENCNYQPMDGATNMPIAADTKEVHLLATTSGRVPDGEKSFSVSLSQNANVSMILMNSFEGTMERRPNVIFPGETTRPYELAFKDEPAAAPSPKLPSPADGKGKEINQLSPAKPETRPSWSVAGIAAAVIAGVLALVFLRRAKR